MLAGQIDLLEGLKLLLPAAEADPPLPRLCGVVPQDALRVYLGGSAAWTSGDDLRVIEIKGTDVLRLRRTFSGVAILAKVFSEDGRIVAQIVDNRFYVNPDNFFRMDMPDSHSLVVYDSHQRKVLDVRYLNPHSVKVLGIFQARGALPVVVDENQILIGGLEMTGICASNSGGSLVNVE